MTTPADTAHGDQFHAATRDADQILRTLAGTTTPGAIPTAATWIHDRITTLTRADATGTLTGCPHIDPSAPQVIFTTAWNPTLVACHRCIRALDPPPGQENLCDRCGTHTPDPDLDLVVLTHGPFLLLAGICPDCTKASGLRTARHPHHAARRAANASDPANRAANARTQRKRRPRRR